MVKTKNYMQNFLAIIWRIYCSIKCIPKWVCFLFTYSFDLLDVHKVYFDNYEFLPHTVYYDKDRHIITEIMGGFTQAPYTIDNYQLVSLDNKTPEEMILFKMDYIYKTLKNKDYEYFKYLLIPFYANEIMDILIREEKDTREKENLIKAREIQFD